MIFLILFPLLMLGAVLTILLTADDHNENRWILNEDTTGRDKQVAAP